MDLKKYSQIKKKKICLVSSSGGHLYQLLMMKKSWEKYDNFWVSFNKTDVKSLLVNKKIYFGYYPESRNIANFFKNLFLATSILSTEKPQVVISAGAGLAVPFFIVAKILNIKTIYIEPLDFIKYPSLTGKISYLIVDLFLIQDPNQKKFFPRSKYWGSSL